MQEEWKTPPGFEAYEVSNMGRVRRATRSKTTYIGRMLKPARDNKGYPHMQASMGPGNRRTVRVHRLVALAFIGAPPSPKHMVNHKNGDRTDNRADNLEWVTNSENVRHGNAIRRAKQQQADGA